MNHIYVQGGTRTSARHTFYKPVLEAGGGEEGKRKRYKSLPSGRRREEGEDISMNTLCAQHRQK